MKTTIQMLLSFLLPLAGSLSSDLLYSQSLLSMYNKGVIKFEKDFEIGGDVEDENYLWTQVTEICFDSQGKLFVLDIHESCVKIYDINGKYLKKFGSKGGGPGEFQLAYNIAVDPENNIAINEVGNRRFSLFDNNGIHLKTIPFQKMVRNFKIGPLGKYYIETHDLDFSGKGALFQISQFSPDLKEEIVVGSARIQDEKYSKEGNTRRNIPVPFHPKLVWSVFPSGNILVARSGDYGMKIFSPDLKLIKDIHHKGEREKVTKQDQETFFAGIKGRSPEGKRIRGASNFIRIRTEFPKYKPYFSNITIDHEGFILVHTYKKEDQNQIIDVFTKDGKFINKVKIPAIISSGIFHKGYFYHTRSSDEEFPKIIRYRLRL